MTGDSNKIRNERRAIITKTIFYWPKNYHVDQWNRVEDSKLSPYIGGQFIYDKEAKNIQWGRKPFQ